MPDVERQMDLGSRLKRRREERGISLREIADRTKLSVTTLEALERNDVRRLPGGIFSRAAVRAYAGEVGVDPELTVRDFVARCPDDSASIGWPDAHASQVADAGTTFGRWGVALTIVVPLLLVAALLYSLL